MTRRSLLVDLGLLLLLAVAVAWLNLDWIRLDQAPPPSDAATHGYHAVLHLQSVRSAEGPLQVASRFLLFREHYPPLVHQVNTLVALAIGPGEAASGVTLSLYLLVFTLSMYGLGLRLGNRYAALACGVMACTTPVVVEYSRLYFLDMPLAATVALSLCCLEHSDQLRRPGWSLAFGAAMGLGVLTKWSQPAYLLVSLLWAAGATLRDFRCRDLASVAVGLGLVGAMTAAAAWVFVHPEGPQEPESRDLFIWVAMLVATAAVLRFLFRRPHIFRQGRPGHLVAAFLVGLSVVLPWYAFNWELVFEKLSYQTRILVPYAQVLEGNWRDVQAWLYVGPVLLATGLAMGLVDGRIRRFVLLMAGNLVAGLAIASLLPPDTRYLLPLVPSLVPLALAWMAPLGSAAVVPLLLVVGLGIAQAAWHRAPAVGPYLPTLLEVRNRGGESAMSARPPRPPRPAPGSYPFQELLANLHWAPPDGSTVLIVTALPQPTSDVQPRQLLYHAALMGRDLVVVEVGEDGDSYRPEPQDAVNYLVLYRDAAERRRALDQGRSRGGFPDGLAAGKSFRFESGLFVELLRGAPATSPPGDDNPAEGAGTASADKGPRRAPGGQGIEPARGILPP